MVHTQYHFKVHSSALNGALDRLAQFFIAPLLESESMLREVENVHAEFSRNCNSDDRKLLQLKRSICRPPYSQFSTGAGSMWPGVWSPSYIFQVLKVSLCTGREVHMLSQSAFTFQ